MRRRGKVLVLLWQAEHVLKRKDWSDAISVQVRPGIESVFLHLVKRR